MADEFVDASFAHKTHSSVPAGPKRNQSGCDPEKAKHSEDQRLQQIELSEPPLLHTGRRYCECFRNIPRSDPGRLLPRLVVARGSVRNFPTRGGSNWWPPS